MGHHAEQLSDDDRNSRHLLLTVVIASVPFALVAMAGQQAGAAPGIAVANDDSDGQDALSAKHSPARAPQPTDQRIGMLSQSCSQKACPSPPFHSVSHLTKVCIYDRE